MSGKHNAEWNGYLRNRSTARGRTPCLLFALLLGLMFTWLLATATPVLASPAAPLVLPITQPDGTTFEAVAFGDEWNNGYETTQGYTIVRDAATGFWRYAVLDAQGALVPSALAPGMDEPAGIPKHLREAQRVRPVPLAETQGEPSPLAQKRMGFAGNTGTQPVLVILVQFGDRLAVGTTAGQWSNTFFAALNSVKHYYQEVSYSQLDLVPAMESHGTANDGVVGWLTLGYNHPDTRGDMSNANRRVARDAIIAANPYINYALYDSNGDGYIAASELHITVIVAGYEAAYGGDEVACQPSVWGHHWSLGFSYEGILVEAPRVDGKTVGHYRVGGYTQLGEWHCKSSDRPGHMATIGIIVHEMGHDLNWPDLYDTDDSSYGVGYWSVMGLGSWLKTTGYAGSKPGHPDAWSKWYQGWLAPSQVSTLQTGVSLEQVETSAQVIQLLNNPGGVDWAYNSQSGTGEYFLVENRQQTGYDAGLPGCGLLIWHIDETRPFDNSANATDSNRLVSLMQADGWQDLDWRMNRGDAGDPYPGSSGNRTFDRLSNPNSNLYSGAPSGVSVTNISPECASRMSADLAAPTAPANNVVINEIDMGTPDWVEFYNPLAQAVNMTGWRFLVYRAEGTLAYTYTFRTFTLQPGAYVVLHEGSGTDTATDLYTNDSSAIPWANDSSGAAALTDSGGIGIDFVRWGDSMVVPPFGTGWTGSNAAGPPVGATLGRDALSTDTDHGSDWTSQTPSPGARNTGPLACYRLSTAVSPGGAGYIELSPAPNCAGELYVSGTQVTLTARSAAGYAFDSWSGDAAGSNPSTTLIMDGDKSVTAHFTVQPILRIFLPIVLRQYGAPVPSPSPTRTASPTLVPFFTPTDTPSPTPTSTASPTLIPFFTPTDTPSPTPTSTASPTLVPSFTPTHTPSPTSTPTVTPTPGPVQSIVNPSFETDEAWVFPDTEYPAGYSVSRAHSGLRSARLGIAVGGNLYSYSSVQQAVEIPSGATQANLSCYYFPVSTWSGDDRIYFCVLRSDSDIWLHCETWTDPNQAWNLRTFDLRSYTGQRIRVHFGVRNDGEDGISAVWLDDVELWVQ